MNKTILPSRILIPEGIDLTKWSVIACDQHTSEPQYWDDLTKLVGDSPSTLKMILPEAYLQNDNSKSIEKINETMREYLDDGFLKEYYGYVLTVRKTPFGVTRLGLVLNVNLDDYSFENESESLIRSTEETVLSRIPPRVEIRLNAVLETPHIMLLENDTDFWVIENLYKTREKYKKIYDFELNMNGGSIEGYFIPAEEDIGDMILKAKSSDILFVVGDGNHSLAAAKTIWEHVKKNLPEGETDERQFALCEVVNLQSDGITFEPIHRLVKGVDVNAFIDGMKLMVGGNGFIGMITNDFDRTLDAPSDVAECYEAVQGYIDTYIGINGGEVDYIHGIDTLRTLAESDNSIGIAMPCLDKKELFSEIERHGALPRKTFSMGQALEKRYYLESRKI
ncbi:MAG: DUF1015 domain-containing protein [Clostridia bacterium]